MNTIKNTQVLIVGAGPSGLMMACQLAHHKIPFRIIDKNEHHSGYSGALIIQARTLEIFDQMGIAEKTMAAGIVAHKIKLIFNGKKPLSLELKDLGEGLTKFPNLLMLEQSKTEQILIDYIHGYGYAVERRTALLRICPVSDGVTVILKLPDGSEEIINTPYLIAADGGQSLVRTQLNIPFMGKTHKLSLFVLDGKADLKLPSNTICFSFSKNASSGIFPLTAGRWRIDGTIPKKLEAKEILTFNDIEVNFAQRVRMDVRLYNPQWFSVFHSHQRYAGSFRQNRCFLVGDAAHVISPVGAQGMNTGMQDAYNLAWKLAFVIKGKAKDSLLDTYHAERQPIAKKLVNSTDRAFQMVTSDAFFAKKLRLVIAPLLLKLLFPIIQKQTLVARFLFNAISEIGIHYRKSTLSNQLSLGSFHRGPKPGDRLPYFMFVANGMETNIQNKIKDTRFHLMIFASQTPTEEFKFIAEKYKAFLVTEIIPFNAGTANLYRRLGIKNGCYLIRPDMYIASRFFESGIDHVEKFIDQYLGRFIKTKNILTQRQLPT